METFPSSFPLPNVSLSGDVAPNSLRTQMESGIIRQRRRFTTEQFTALVTWTLSDTEFTVFSAFHKFRLNAGNDWFLMPLPLGGGTQTHVVRFAEGRFIQQYVSVGYWDVRAQLEVQERQTLTENELDFYLVNGFSDTAIAALLADVNSFHTCVHETIPDNLN